MLRPLMMHLRLCVLCGFTVCISSRAFAQNFPQFQTTGLVELQSNYAASSQDSGVDEENQLFYRWELYPSLQINENLNISAVAIMEPVNAFDAGQSSIFEEEGVFIEELKLTYGIGNWQFFAGKFNPGYGIAWDFGRGLFSEDFNEDYEITGQIGGGVAYTYFDDQIGSHVLSGNSFFTDTSFLAESTINSIGTTSLSDGGSGNTEDFSSFVIALDGSDVGGIDNLYYKLGYRFLAQGEADAIGGDEEGFVITLGHVFPITDRIQGDLLLEHTDIQNFGGGLDDFTYSSASLITTIDNHWLVTLAYTERDIDLVSGGRVDDYLLEVSTGYNFGQGTTAEIGWRSAEEAGIQSDIIGGLIRHYFAF